MRQTWWYRRCGVVVGGREGGRPSGHLLDRAVRGLLEPSDGRTTPACIPSLACSSTVQLPSDATPRAPSLASSCQLPHLVEPETTSASLPPPTPSLPPPTPLILLRIQNGHAHAHQAVWTYHPRRRCPPLMPPLLRLTLSPLHPGQRDGQA
jgi:hypothetical protein